MIQTFMLILSYYSFSSDELEYMFPLVSRLQCINFMHCVVICTGSLPLEIVAV